MLRTLAVAISFLTIVPVSTGPVAPETITRSAVFFPLAGWLVGFVMAGAGWLLLAAGLTPLVAAVIMVILAAWLTRGLHLDGVADLCDGLGGSHEPERRLAIMKDSATGAFGVVGLVLLLLLKVAGLAALLGYAEGGPAAERFFLFLMLAFVPAMARFAMTTLAWKSPYPRESGTGHVFVGRVRGSHLLVGGCWLLPVLFALPLAACGPGCLAGAFLFPLLAAVFLRRRACRMLGGVTGDVLGASCECGEALGWLGIVLFFGP